MNKILHPTKIFTETRVSGARESAVLKKVCDRSSGVWQNLRFKSAARILLVVLLSISSLIARGQLTARFTATDTAGCAPLIVRFTNASTGATSYSWDLGNGNTSALTDAAASYPSAGTYTVTLTASSGGSSTTYSMVLRIYGKPVVNFTANDTAVCENTSITFSSTSAPNAWGGLTYIWNFGDGGSSTATTPSYSYPSPGYYNATLFATNVKGCSNSLTRDAYIHIFSPASAIFSAVNTTLCGAPATASFVNATTGKPPLTYTWAFGDGSTSTAVSPAHTYTTPASYDVKLIVHDGDGCTDSSLQLKFITLGNIKAGFSSPANGCLFTPISFKNTSSPHIYSQWYFGDGGTSSADTPSYSYSSPGTYIVKLVVFDGTCYDSVIHTVAITKPTGSFTISPLCSPYSTQTFTASVPPGSTVSWDFGDKSAGSGTTASHTYHPKPHGAEPPPNPDPIYNVSMIVTSSLGCNDTVNVADTVKNLVIVLNTKDSSTGCMPFVANFTVSAIYKIINPAPPCTGCDLLIFPYPHPVVTYLWNFGDGSPTSSSPAPTHTYTLAGVFHAMCTVTTSDGCSATNTFDITVGTRQTASFTISKTHVCAGQPITYTSTSSSTAYIDMYSWNFGDGVDAVGPPSHGFNQVTHRSEQPGIHTVLLTVLYNGCKSNLDSLTDTIDVANATISDHYNCIPPTSISFGDSSKGDDAHLWQFGDGDTSTAPNPLHIFPALDSYWTTLTTYNIKTGCRDTSSILIKLKRLQAKLSPFDTVICRDQRDTISAFITTTDTTQPVKSNWFINGSPIDTTFPIVSPNMTANPPYVDTIRHLMHIRGSDNIMMILTDNHGCFDTVSKIVAVAKPIDSFSLTPLVTCPATAISFTDHSSDIPGFSITKYYWSYGDGSFSTSVTPSVIHTYTAAGTYIVKEIVTDNLGCADTFTNSSHPLVHKPAAAFIAGSTYNCKGTTINFTNTSTGGISWLWMFGDGGTSTLSLPSHTYTTVGTYTVKLVAYDAYGCTDTASKSNLISINPLPTASFHLDDSFAVCSPLNVNFINTSIGASFYNWTFGDGNSSVSVYPSDIYTTPGVYTVKLKVSNSYGCIDTAFAHATVFGYAGAFLYTPVNACAGVPVHFSAKISGVTSVVWDFNDGYISTPSTKDSISHAYLSVGKYLPKLILTDFANCSSFSDGIDTIRVDTIMAKFASSPEPVCQNSNITFRDSSSGIYSAPATWLWTFAPGATSTARAPVYAYSVSGSLPVTLLVKNGFGCAATVTKNVTVNPVPASIAGMKSICNGLSAILSDINAGGAWTSVNTSVATIGTSGLVTGLSPGTSTIAYTFVTGCKTTTTETVYPLPSAITGGRTMCAGDIISLSDLSPGGTWTSSNTASIVIGSGSGVVIAVATGTATITYQVASGCIATSILKVDSSPVNITGPTVLCAGDTLRLSDGLNGGSWSSSNTSAAVIDPVKGIVTGRGGGTAIITYMLTTGCRTTTTITINAVPLAISGKATVCTGLTTFLSDASGGGTWSSQTPGVAAISAGTVTGVSAGTSTITYALSTGCRTVRIVTVNPLPSSITGISGICVKLSTTLSDAAAGGSWSSPDPTVSIGSISGIVTGISTGTATITYSLSTGCIASRLLTVNPVPSAITGPKNICVGLTTTLVDDTTGGSWTSPDPSVSVGFRTGIAKGITVGTATISYTLSTGCYTLASVTVNPMPFPIKGNTQAICAGSAISLTDSLAGGAWSSGNSSIASVDGSGLTTGVSAGTTAITYTSGVGCTAMTTVTVYPIIAAINGKTAVCKGATITLSDATPGGNWRSSNNAVATVSTSGLVTGLITGIATISYSALNTCDTAIAFIEVDPLPNAGTIAGNSTLCTGVSELLTDSVKGGSWSSATSTIATVDASGTVTAVATGIADITYSYTNSCGTAQTGIALTINQTPPPVHITTHPDSTLCANTLFQNFGSDLPEPPGIHYTWSAENAIIYATSSNRQYCLVNFTVPGNIVIKLSTSQSATDCISGDSLAFNISTEKSPLPVVVYYPPEFVCKDNTADSYQWGYDDATTLDSTLLPGMVNENYYNVNPDFKKYNYWVLTYHNGCLQKSYYNAPENINKNTNNNDYDIIIFPNPAGSEINIEVKGTFKPGLTEVKLFDILGKERITGNIVDGSGKLTLTALPPEVYMLIFSRDGIKIGSKIFVKR